MKLLLATLLATTLLAACTTTPQAQFYTLGSRGVAQPQATESTVSLAIGPIDLPQYLDRPQIVTRDNGNRLRVDEFNRWGGSLEEEIHRVLAERLGARLGTQRIYRYPSRIVAETDYRVALDVRVFDGELAGAVRLDAAWSLIDDRTANVVLVRRSQFAGEVGDGGYGSYAAVLGDLLGQLGDELAVAIGATKKSPPQGDGQTQ